MRLQTSTLTFGLLMMLLVSGCIQGEPQDIEYFTSDAVMNKMMNAFATGEYKVLATMPTNKPFESGNNVGFAIGVKKSSTVEDEKRYFNICIGKAGEYGCTPGGQEPFEAFGDDSGIKFAFAPALRIDNRGDIKTEDASMRIPAGTAPRIYGYTIYVCAKESADVVCTGAGDPDYYGDYRFIVEIA